MSSTRLLKVHNLLVVPQAGGQAFNLWIFGGTLKSQTIAAHIQSLLVLFCVCWGSWHCALVCRAHRGIRGIWFPTTGGTGGFKPSNRGTGIWTHILWKSSIYSEPVSHLSSTSIPLSFPLVLGGNVAPSFRWRIKQLACIKGLRYMKKWRDSLNPRFFCQEIVLIMRLRSLSSSMLTHILSHLLSSGSTWMGRKTCGQK